VTRPLAENDWSEHPADAVTAVGVTLAVTNVASWLYAVPVNPAARPVAFVPKRNAGSLEFPNTSRLTVG